MTLSANDLAKLVELLRGHPEWKEQLRAVLLTEELLRLPGVVSELAAAVRDLAEVQARSEERLSRLEAAVQELTEAQRRHYEEFVAFRAEVDARFAEMAQAVAALTGRVDRLEQVTQQLAEAVAALTGRVDRLEQVTQQLTEAVAALTGRVDRLEQAVAELAEAQRRTEEELRQLAEAQARTEERLSRLEQVTQELVEVQHRFEERLTRLERRVGKLEGRDLERYYRERAAAIFGRAGFRRCRVLAIDRISDMAYEWEEKGLITPEERQRLQDTDLIVTARRDDREVWLAVEVSVKVDKYDVERAVESARIIGKVAPEADSLAVVAGEDLTRGAEASARSHGVVFFTNGRWKQLKAS